MSSSRHANLIIAGVNKGGTTSLFSYLSRHPDICPSSVKETCFFLPLRYGEAAGSLEAYAEFFRDCRSQRMRMESTPGYFYGGYAVAEAIAAACPGAVVLLIFRDPADRAFSFYRFMQSMLQIDRELAFSEYVRRCRRLAPEDLRQRSNNPWFGIQGGFYAEYLAPWIQTFPDRLHVLFFDDLKAHPAIMLRNLCVRISLDPAPFDEQRNDGFDAENRSVEPRHTSVHRMALAVNRRAEPWLRRMPWLKRRVRRLYGALNTEKTQKRLTSEMQSYLRELYAGSNRRLYEMLHRELGMTEFPRWMSDDAV